MSLKLFLADAAPAAAQQQPPTWMTLVPFALMFVALYFVMIRPQSKKAKQHAEMLKAVRPGDKIVTSGGLIGIVVSVKERSLAIRSAETKLEVLKSAVTEITERSGEAAATES
ncbi:MAG TPA: preprotein translocase subunit YajC [Verrucomicrobiae bacterium]|jgi:preprotein translocase subunit YajC|nr:preprotein translocase subunit YajC [Verrucomicrobiae bacterium]